MSHATLTIPSIIHTTAAYLSCNRTRIKKMSWNLAYKHMREINKRYTRRMKHISAEPTKQITVLTSQKVQTHTQGGMERKNAQKHQNASQRAERWRRLRKEQQQMSFSILSPASSLLALRSDIYLLRESRKEKETAARDRNAKEEQKVSFAVKIHRNTHTAEQFLVSSAALF